VVSIRCDGHALYIVLDPYYALLWWETVHPDTLRQYHTYWSVLIDQFT